MSLAGYTMNRINIKPFRLRKTTAFVVLRRDKTAVS